MKKNYTLQQYTDFLINNLKDSKSLHSVSRLSPFAWLQDTNISYKTALIEFVKNNNIVERITVTNDNLTIDDIFTSEIFTQDDSIAKLDIEAINTFVNKIFKNDISRKTFKIITSEIGYLILDSLLIFSLIHSKNGILVNSNRYKTDAEKNLSNKFEVLIYDKVAYEVNTIKYRGQLKYSIVETDRNRYFDDWLKTYRRFEALEVSIIDHIKKIKEKYKIEGNYQELKEIINEELNIIEILEEREKNENLKRDALKFLKKNKSLKRPSRWQELIDAIEKNNSIITNEFLNYILEPDNDIETILMKYNNLNKYTK